MIYFDNAATGGFKPGAVFEATQTATRYLCANPGRSGHRLSITGANTVYETRKILGELFNAPTEKVIFTKNCTEALNLGIFGTLRKGGHVITTVFEHNSVLRPLTQLERLGLITLDIVSPDERGILCAIEEKITPATYLIVMTSASNVTGEVMPYSQVGALAKKRGIMFLCDGAQGAGHVKIDLREDGISMLAVAGHKGLYGIMGSGALVIDEKTEVNPIIFGGTGTESFNLRQPECYPEKLESGTLPLPAITSLKEGAKYVKESMKNFSTELINMTDYLIEELKKTDTVKIYSKPNPTGIVSFAVKDIDSTEVADALNREYDVAVRGGLHCAPLIHKFLGTDKSGLVRVSLAVQNTYREISFFIRALNSVIKN